VFGRDVGVGDVIFGVNGNELERTEVLEITHHVTRGAYVPLTKEGTLIVDGIYVSCYASYRHALAHRFLAPVRAFPALLHLRPGFLGRLGAWAKSLVTGSAFFSSGSFSAAVSSEGNASAQNNPEFLSLMKPKDMIFKVNEVNNGECRECYSCPDCSTVSSSTFTTSCSASCLAIVTCLAGKAPRVTRSCSLTNEPNGCRVVANPTDYTKACYCDGERCDPVLGLTQDQLCDDALPSTLASLALTFFAFFVVQVLNVAEGFGYLSF
ncbi:hypothetical protein Pcinc_015792, partial [Petrolisthes cinctipes]